MCFTYTYITELLLVPICRSCNFLILSGNGGAYLSGVFYHGVESLDFYIHTENIMTERVRIVDIISLILNDFSYGKAQIPHRIL